MNLFNPTTNRTVRPTTHLQIGRMIASLSYLGIVDATHPAGAHVAVCAGDAEKWLWFMDQPDAGTIDERWTTHGVKVSSEVADGGNVMSFSVMGKTVTGELNEFGGYREVPWSIEGVAVDTENDGCGWFTMDLKVRCDSVELREVLTATVYHLGQTMR